MLSKIPKNLLPKFSSNSKIPTEVKDIIYEVIDKPLKIRNYLGYDNPLSSSRKQISSFNNNIHTY